MKENGFLDTIVGRRREDVASLDARKLRAAAESSRHQRGSHRLRAALAKTDAVNIIAEFKRASPSLGFIRADASVTEMVARYEKSGACALSILTEPVFFHGSLDDLCAARARTTLPLLRKDFIVSEAQIDEAATAGADAILLIVAALSDRELHDFRIHAEEDLRLDALVEVHTEEELSRATTCGATLIGVNNRDLHTFVTSLETSERLAALAPPGTILVSESGISSKADVLRLRRCGYSGFLVGESLMRADDPTALIQSLQGKGPRVKVCGVTKVEDALLCAELGVEMLGLNFSPESKRCLSPKEACALVEAVRPRFPTIEFVGVFVNQPLEFVRETVSDLDLDAVQLHGDESPDYVRELAAPFTIKTVQVNGADALQNAGDYDCDAILLDSYSALARGGTGKRFEWSAATALQEKVKRLILAGGLTPDNIGAAMKMVQPFAVDVCSGVEESPGKKNHDKLRRFVAAARAVG